MFELEDLLTLAKPLREGRMIDTPSQEGFLDRWFSGLRKEDKSPVYRLHYTKAGLPMVLPHNKGGRLYTADNLQKSPLIPNQEIPLPDGFYLTLSLRASDEQGLVFLSQVTRPIPKELKFGGYINVNHLVDRNGQIISSRIYYDLLDREITFHANRNPNLHDNNKVIAVAKLDFSSRFAIGPEGDLYWMQQNLGKKSPKIPFKADLQGSLSNLVEIIKNPSMSREDVLALAETSYLVPKREIPPKELLN